MSNCKFPASTFPGLRYSVGMKKVEVRKARAGDVAAIAQLWRQMMDYHFTLDPRFALSAQPETPYMSYVRGLLEQTDQTVLVAELDGRIVGYVIGFINHNAEIFQRRRFGFLAELMVEPELRQSGIGMTLWKAIKSWYSSRGVKDVELHCSVYNTGGESFWKKCGFKEYLKVLWREL